MSLTSIMRMGAQGLKVAQAGLRTTSENISNWRLSIAVKYRVTVSAMAMRSATSLPLTTWRSM